MRWSGGSDGTTLADGGESAAPPSPPRQRVKLDCLNPLNRLAMPPQLRSVSPPHAGPSERARLIATRGGEVNVRRGLRAGSAPPRSVPVAVVPLSPSGGHATSGYQMLVYPMWYRSVDQMLGQRNALAGRGDAQGLAPHSQRMAAAAAAAAGAVRGGATPLAAGQPATTMTTGAAARPFSSLGFAPSSRTLNARMHK